MNPHYDVLCIGNAIVDLIARAEEDFLTRFQIAKGSMNLIDEERAETLYKALGPATITSGGSAGNTAAGIASFGGKVAYFGKVRDDELGHVFSHDLTSLGVHFPTPKAGNGLATARCFVVVTPDGERTMNTYLGACTTFGPADLDQATIENAGIVYFEGYLWDPPAAKDAIRKAAAIARAAGREVAITLSDSFCVDRYRDEFLDLIRSKTVDIVFANEHELKSLYQTADFDAALASLREDASIGVVTRSEKGAVYVTREATVAAPAFPVETVVDSTGAGDLFAAGFLHGRARKQAPLVCLKLGMLAASRVIQQIGPRLPVSLKGLAEQEGLPV
jgi:sugar/nucleoside kinase (ribokinase family)